MKAEIQKSLRMYRNNRNLEHKRKKEIFNEYIFSLCLECLAPISLLLIFDNDYMNNTRLLWRKSFFSSFRLKIFKLFFFRISQHSSTLINFFDGSIDSAASDCERCLFSRASAKANGIFCQSHSSRKHWSGATSCLNVLCISALGLIIGGAGVSSTKSLEWKAVVGQQRNSIADDDVDTLVHNYFMQSHY